MSNFYTKPTDLVSGTTARASDINDRVDSVESGFDSAELVTIRSIKLPVGTTADQLITESSANRASKTIGFDTSGDLVLYSPYNWQGDWTTTTEYALHDTVRDASTKNLYFCMVVHTSGTFATDLAASKWSLAINVADVETAKTAAETAQTAAELAETNAETAQTAAELAETNAETAQTAAELAETNASTSASTATTQATTATTQATNAATSATAASTSATNAATSATAASTSATNAATSASTATTQATNAATSASTATTQATNAATSETNAATSETNAATSATTATTQATNAATSATTATTQATNASTSATNASTSETNASTAKTAAETAQTAAETAETNAATSATAASTSATNSATSATASLTAQTAAELAETNAETAETNAATSATNANTAKLAAEAAQTAAELASDTFEDTYLGAKASNPTVDNDGDALTTGDLYFNTTSDEMRVYNGTSWQTAAVSTASMLALTGGAMTGAITTSSTFDGRDVSVDGTKLDGIETSATADQTASEIKTAYESNADTNEFSDTEQTKLAGIATNANNYSLPSSVVHDTEKGALHATDALRISGHSVQLHKGDGSYESVTVPDNNTTYSNATTSSSGLMSNTDKSKLDGVATNANNYSLPSSVVHDTEKGALHATDALRISGHTVQLYKGDGSSESVTVPDNNTTYSNATTSSSGLMSNTDKSKLDGVATSANNYTHPANNHLPSGGTVGQVLTNVSSGNGSWADASGGGGILSGIAAGGITAGDPVVVNGASPQGIHPAGTVSSAIPTVYARDMMSVLDQNIDPNYMQSHYVTLCPQIDAVTNLPNTVLIAHAASSYGIGTRFVAREGATTGTAQAGVTYSTNAMLIGDMKFVNTSKFPSDISYFFFVYGDSGNSNKLTLNWGKVQEVSGSGTADAISFGQTPVVVDSTSLGNETRFARLIPMAEHEQSNGQPLVQVVIAYSVSGQARFVKAGFSLSNYNEISTSTQPTISTYSTGSHTLYSPYYGDNWNSMTSVEGDASKFIVGYTDSSYVSRVVCGYLGASGSPDPQSSVITMGTPTLVQDPAPYSGSAYQSIAPSISKWRSDPNKFHMGYGSPYLHSNGSTYWGGINIATLTLTGVSTLTISNITDLYVTQGTAISSTYSIATLPFDDDRLLIEYTTSAHQSSGYIFLSLSAGVYTGETPYVISTGYPGARSNNANAPHVFLKSPNHRIAQVWVRANNSTHFRLHGMDVDHQPLSDAGVVGVAADTKLNGEEVDVVTTSGVASGLTGLVAGSDYYTTLSGVLSTSPDPDKEMYTGVAMTATDLAVRVNAPLPTTNMVKDVDSSSLPVLGGSPLFINSSGTVSAVGLTTNTTTNITQDEYVDNAASVYSDTYAHGASSVDGTFAVTVSLDSTNNLMLYLWEIAGDNLVSQGSVVLDSTPTTNQVFPSPAIYEDDPTNTSIQKTVLVLWGGSGVSYKMYGMALRIDTSTYTVDVTGAKTYLDGGSWHRGASNLEFAPTTGLFVSQSIRYSGSYQDAHLVCEVSNHQTLALTKLSVTNSPEPSVDSWWYTHTLKFLPNDPTRYIASWKEMTQGGHVPSVFQPTAVCTVNHTTGVVTFGTLLPISEGNTIPPLSPYSQTFFEHYAKHPQISFITDTKFVMTYTATTSSGTLYGQVTVVVGEVSGTSWTSLSRKVVNYMDGSNTSVYGNNAQNTEHMINPNPTTDKELLVSFYTSSGTCYHARRVTIDSSNNITTYTDNNVDTYSVGVGDWHSHAGWKMKDTYVSSSELNYWSSKRYVNSSTSRLVFQQYNPSSGDYKWKSFLWGEQTTNLTASTPIVGTALKPPVSGRVEILTSGSEDKNQSGLTTGSLVYPTATGSVSHNNPLSVSSLGLATSSTSILLKG